MIIAISTIFFLFTTSVTLAQIERSYDRVNDAVIGERRGAKLIDAKWAGDENTDPGEAKLSALTDRVAARLQDGDKLMAQAANGQVNAMHNAQQSSAAGSSRGVHAHDVDSGRSAVASGANNRASAATRDGDDAQAALLLDRNRQLQGGRVQTNDGHTGDMKNYDNGNRVALRADRQYEINGLASDTDLFQADASDRNDPRNRGRYGVRSESITGNTGLGQIMSKDTDGAGLYRYNFDGTRPDHLQADFQPDSQNAAQSAFQRRLTGWKCAAVTDGESLCRDINGQIVGKVMTNARGEAIVVDSNGVVMGRGKAKRVADEKYEVTLSDGLALATTDMIRRESCYDEVAPGGTAPEENVKIENLIAKVEGQQLADGTETFSWPSCFDIEADVTIPAGIDPARVAIEYVGHVMPLGSLACQDTMTCGRSCYYCNACEKEKVLGDDAKLTFETQDFCSLHDGGGRTQRLSMKVCPPQDTEKAAFCGGFDRHIVGNDYFRYNSTINAQMRVWLRPPNEADLRTQYFDSIRTNLGKFGLQNLYKLENILSGSFRTPSDNELLEWYVRKNGEEKLMACERGIINFNVGGSDVNSNLMIDAFANPQMDVQIFSDAPCQQWLDAQNREYAVYQKQYRDSQGPAPPRPTSGGFTFPTNIRRTFPGRGRK